MTGDDRKQSWWGEIQTSPRKWPLLIARAHLVISLQKPPAAANFGIAISRKGRHMHWSWHKLLRPIGTLQTTKNPWNPEDNFHTPAIPPLFTPNGARTRPATTPRPTKTSVAQCHKRKRARNQRRPSPIRPPNPHPAQVSPPSRPNLRSCISANGRAP